MAKKNNVRIFLDKKDGSPQIDITGYLLQGSGIKIKRALHNKGKAVISTAQCTVKNSVGTVEDKKSLKDGSAFVKRLIDLSEQNEGPEDKRPIVRIIKMPEKKSEQVKVMFTGYLRLGLKIDIKGHYSTEATALSLEFVSLLESLENIKTPAKMYHQQAGYKISELMDAIVKNTALPSHITFNYANITDTDVIGSYEVESEEPVFDVLQDIAFAYGYVMVTKGDGTIDFKKWWVENKVTVKSLNQSDIMGDVKFQQKEMRKVRVQVDYSSYKVVNDYLFLIKGENVACKTNKYTKTLLNGNNDLTLELNDTDLNDGYNLLSVTDHYVKAWGSITGECPNVANATADKVWKVSAQSPVNETLEAKGGAKRPAYVPKDSQFSGKMVYEIDSKAHFAMSLASSTNGGKRLKAKALLETENKGVWGSCTSASLRLELRGKAAMHTTKDNARVMSGEGKVKKISALSIDDKKYAERLAKEYKRAVEDGSYRMSFTSRKAIHPETKQTLALGDMFKMNFKDLNFEAAVRVLKIEQVMSPDDSVFHYTLEKIGKITASAQATQDTFKDVILPKIRKGKLATVDEAQRIVTKAIDNKNFVTMEEAQRIATKAIHKTLMTNTKDGGIIPINVKVNNRQVTVEIYSHGDDPSGRLKFHYTYLYSTDKVTWKLFKKSNERIAIKTFVPFDADTTTVYIRVTGYATYRESGVQKFVDAVSEVVEVEIAKVKTKDLSTQDNFKMDSLLVKNNLHIGTQDPKTGRGQGETIINSKDVKIGDTLIDINALEGGDGVSTTTPMYKMEYKDYDDAFFGRYDMDAVVFNNQLLVIGGIQREYTKN